MIRIIIIIKIIIKVILIVIDLFIIIKDKDNDNDDENNAQNKDNEIYPNKYKIESMWMIILNNNTYNNNK